MQCEFSFAPSIFINNQQNSPMPPIFTLGTQKLFVEDSTIDKIRFINNLFSIPGYLSTVK